MAKLANAEIYNADGTVSMVPILDVVESSDGGITSLTGDVTAGPGDGAQAATVVQVGGALAAAIAAGVALANAGTSANTASTLVKRGASGEFTAGLISADDLTLTGAASDADLTLTAGGVSSVITQSATGNKPLTITNGGFLVFGADLGTGTIGLGSFALNGNNQPLRTNAGVSAGTQSIDGSAMLQADSTAKGFLPPRMTTTQRDAIATPAEGLQIWNTTTHLPNFYDGTSWKAPVIA